MVGETQRRRQPVERRTAAFNLNVSSLKDLDRLIANEVYGNKSQAVDAALKLLFAVHRDELADGGEREAA